MPDTVELVQPGFYRALPFSTPGARGLVTGVRGNTLLDRAIELVEAGASTAQLELPREITEEVDEGLKAWSTWSNAY